MKLVFNTLSTDSGSIEVSFDGGLTWIKYNIADLRKNNNEIVFSEEQCPDLTKIKIKGKFKTYSDIDALYNPNTIVTVAKGDSDSTVSSTAVVSYVDDQIGSLNQDKTGSRGSYIEAISEKGGIITATSVPLDTVVNEESTHNTAPSSKAVYSVLQNLGNVYNIKDGVATKDNLPADGNSNGDVRACQDTGISYVWIEDKWTEIGGASLNTALDFAGANIDGEDTAFITQVTQNDGLVSATKASIPKASLTESGIVKLSDSLTSSLTTTAATSSTVATLKTSIDEEISDRESETSSLKLSLNNEISDRKTAISEEAQYRDFAIKQALAGITGNLNCTSPNEAYTPTVFKQTNGNVSVVFSPIKIKQSQVTGLTDSLEAEIANRNEAITQTVASLSAQTTGKDGAYIKTIKELNGIISTSVEPFDTSLDITSTDNNAPTSKTVYNKIIEEANARDTADKAEVTARDKAIKDAIDALDVIEIGSDGKYIQKILESDGKISTTLKDFDKEIDSSSDDTNVPTSKAVYSLVQTEALKRNEDDTTLKGIIDKEVAAREAAVSAEAKAREDAISALSVDESGSSGKFIQKISETGGKISVTTQDFDTTISEGSVNAPTSGAVYTAIQNLGNVYHIKESVENKAALPTEKNTAGDVRNCNDTGDNYVWTGTDWDQLGGSSLINALSYNGATEDGNSTSFITNVTQSNGVISATKAAITPASTSTAGIVQLDNTTTSDSVATAATAAVAKSLQDQITVEITNRESAVTNAITSMKAYADSASAAATAAATSETNAASSATAAATSKANAATYATNAASSATSASTSATTATSEATAAATSASSASTSATTATSKATAAANSATAAANSATAAATSETNAANSATAAANAVSNAISGLIDTLSGTPDAGKTITAFDEVGGKVSATFSNISIEQSQVSGLETALSNKQASGNYKTTQEAVSDPTASGDTTSFIDTISQNTNGVISVTKKTVTSATQSSAGLMSASDKEKLDGIATGASSYNTITAAEITTGTSTEQRVVTPKVLADNFLTTSNISFTHDTTTKSGKLILSFKKN